MPDIKTFLNTDREWHYFWMGAFVMGCVFFIIRWFVNGRKRNA